MYIIKLETVKKLLEIWKKAALLEASGCLFFEPEIEKEKENSKEKEKDKEKIYMSDGILCEDIPKNSRLSLPFSCSENNLSLNFHSHPTDKRNTDEMYYLSPPSGADLKLRYILTVMNEKSLPFSLVLSKEGIYILDTMLKLSQNAKDDIKQFKTYFRDSLLKLVNVIKTKFNKNDNNIVNDNNKNKNTNAKIDFFEIVESIAKLPDEDAINALLIECMPSFNEIFDVLIEKLEASTDWDGYLEMAKNFDIYVVLFKYDKEIRYHNYNSEANNVQHNNSLITEKFLNILNSNVCKETTLNNIREMIIRVPQMKKIN